MSVALPRELGELYATVVNGQGYQNVGEADDRFKDWAARLSVTPFAGREAMPAVLRGIVQAPDPEGQVARLAAALNEGAWAESILPPWLPRPTLDGPVPVN